MKTIKTILFALTIMISGFAFAQTNNTVKTEHEQLKGPRAKNQTHQRAFNTNGLPVQNGTQVKRTGGTAKNTPIHKRERTNTQQVITKRDNTKGPKAKNRKHNPNQTPLFQRNKQGN